MAQWFSRFFRKCPKAKAADVDTVRNFRACFNTDAGQRVLEHLFRACHMDSTVHVPGDALGSAYVSGKRDTFLYIINIMEAENE